MAEKISVRIGLEGGKEVEEQLADIGEAGQKAFEDINKAAASQTDGFEKVADELTKTGQAAKTSGEEVAATAPAFEKAAKASDQLAESHRGLSLETVKTSLEITKLAAEIVKVGTEIAGLHERHKGLIGTIIDLTLRSNNLVKGMSLIAPEFAAIATAVGVVVVGATAAVKSFETLEAVARKAVGDFDKLTFALEDVARKTDISFDGLQRGEAAFAQLGLSADKFRGTISALADEINGLDVDDAFKESADAIVEADKKVFEAEKAVIEQRVAGHKTFLIGEDTKLTGYLNDLDRLNKLQKDINSEDAKAKEAQDKLLSAQHEQAKARANSLSTVLELIKRIEGGEKGVTFDSLTTAETKAKALAISLREAGEAGKIPGQVLIEFIKKADEASAIEIGKQFKLAEEDVEKVRRGTADTLEIYKRIQSAGVLIPPEAKQSIDDARVATEHLESTQARLKQAWDSSIFAKLGEDAIKAMDTIKAAVNEAAAFLVESFSAAGTGMSDMWGNTFREFYKIGEAVDTAIQYVVEFGRMISSLTWDNIVNAGVQAWNSLTTAIGNAITKLAEWLGLKSKAGGDAPSGGGASAHGFARGGRIGGRGSGTSDSNLAWVSRGEYILPAHVVSKPGVLAFLEALRDGGASRSRGGLPAFADGGSVGGGGGVIEAVSVMASVRQIIDAVAQSLARLTFTMVDGMRGVMRSIDSLMQTFSETIDQAIHEDLRTASNTLWDFEQAVRNAHGHARGGLLGGRGSGTSDSNLAWVSRGEHIMPAYAVRQPGVLSFLEMLRRSGGNLSRALNGLGRYAAGGLVMPSLASGAVGGMNNVTIQFPGLPPISGLRASSQVVEELRRSAAMAQVRSGGRKPSRYT